LESLRCTLLSRQAAILFCVWHFSQLRCEVLSTGTDNTTSTNNGHSLLSHIGTLITIFLSDILKHILLILLHILVIRPIKVFIFFANIFEALFKHWHELFNIILELLSSVEWLHVLWQCYLGMTMRHHGLRFLTVSHVEHWFTFYDWDV
jgi:hypothetical protein